LISEFSRKLVSIVDDVNVRHCQISE